MGMLEPRWWDPRTGPRPGPVAVLRCRQPSKPGRPKLQLNDLDATRSEDWQSRERSQAFGQVRVGSVTVAVDDQAEAVRARYTETLGTAAPASVLARSRRWGETICKHQPGITLATSTGFSIPLRGSTRRWSNLKGPPRTSSRTTSVTSISPPWASAATRAATVTEWP